MLPCSHAPYEGSVCRIGVGTTWGGELGWIAVIKSGRPGPYRLFPGKTALVAEYAQRPAKTCGVVVPSR